MKVVSSLILTLILTASLAWADSSLEYQLNGDQLTLTLRSQPGKLSAIMLESPGSATLGVGFTNSSGDYVISFGSLSSVSGTFRVRGYVQIGGIQPTNPVTFTLGGSGSGDGETYYVCDCNTAGGQQPDSGCILGSDNNSGTSPQSPWRTFSKANSEWRNNLNCGDEILFCRGGAWRSNSENWNHGNDCANQPMVVSDYNPTWASGNEDDPYFWSNGKVWNFESNYSGNHSGAIVRNFKAECPNSSADDGSKGVYCAKRFNHLTIENFETAGCDYGTHNATINDKSCNDMTISDGYTHHAHSQGHGGSGHRQVVRRVLYDTNAEPSTRRHGGMYLLHPGGPRDNQDVWHEDVIVEENEVRNASLLSSNTCEASQITGHGPHVRLRVFNNFLSIPPENDHNGCVALAFSNNSSNTTRSRYFIDSAVYGNRVENSGASAIKMDSQHNPIVENNVMARNGTSFPYKGAIKVTKYKQDYPDADSRDVTVRFNSIFQGEHSSGKPGGIFIEPGVAGNQDNQNVGNAIYYSGDDSDWKCFDLDNRQWFSESDYNLCYFPNAAGTKWEASAGGGTCRNASNKSALTNWQNLSGFDGNSICADPGWVDPTGYDLHIASANSPLVDAIPVSSGLCISQDTEGSPRLANGFCDIGAYEFSAETLASLPAPGTFPNLANTKFASFALPGSDHPIWRDSKGIPLRAYWEVHSTRAKIARAKGLKDLIDERWVPKSVGDIIALEYAARYPGLKVVDPKLVEPYAPKGKLKEWIAETASRLKLQVAMPKKNSK